jgi:hypothetical protein
MKLFRAITLVIGFAAVAIAQETNATIHAIFKQYDIAVLQKITDHWYEILDSMPSKAPRPVGKVVLGFHLFPDGHVSDLQVDSSDVEASLVEPCKKAVADSAPFASWTKEIRQAYTNDLRVLHFTFYFDRGPTPPESLQPTASAPSVSTNK